MQSNDLTGQKLGTYQLNRIIGSGGYATVYLGRHVILQRDAAIKVLKEVVLNEEDQAGFHEEARLISRLVHPNIIKVLDADIEMQKSQGDGSVPYLVMEHAQQGSLRDRHPRGTVVAFKQIASYVEQIASALHYAHEQKVLHLDVKPENVLVMSSGNIVLSDFGIAVTGHDEEKPLLIKDDVVEGTALYTAPERYRQRAGRACDQYSLAVVVYEWLTGRCPFVGQVYQIINEHISAPPPPLYGRYSYITKKINDVVLRALAKDPAARFPSILEFAQALNSALLSASEGPVAAPSPVISGFISDAPDGQDFLGIKKEVEALCSVLAAKDVEPPLSLGLFGDWGSGKSFFMRMMQERIELLKEAAQRAEGETAYCKNIVQLKFNAWHYIDTDLWASLTSEIFDGLAFALARKDNTEEEYTHKRLLADVAAVSSKDELAQAERKEKDASAQLREREQKLRELKQSESSLTGQTILTGALNVALRQPEMREFVEEVGKELNAEFAKADPILRSELEEVEKKIDNPTLRAMETEALVRNFKLDGKWGRLQAFMVALRNSRDRQALLLTVGVVIIILVVVSLLVAYRGLLAGLLTLIVGIPVALTPLFGFAWHAVSIFRQVQSERIKLLNEARKRKLVALQQETVEAQNSVKKAQELVEKARLNVRDAEREVELLRANPQMSDFIKQRQASTDYTRHLGVIARARDDFNKLSMLLAKEKEGENSVNRERRLLPRIDRIILYIDDLDRCPEKRVVEVLQAVHLLLAFPLFVVVVGVDSRWLVHSLKQQYKPFQGEGDGLSKEGSTEWQATPFNYLEKIFQIPFTLHPMRATGFEQLVDNLTSQREGARTTEVRSSQTVNEETTKRVEENAFKEDVSILRQSSGFSLNPSSAENTPPAIPILAIDTPSWADVDMNPGFLQIEDGERTVMKILYRFIPSPRAAKRFVNIYRLLRASIDIHEMPAFMSDENGGQHRVVLLLLAMLVGYPTETTEIFCDLLERKHEETWWSFIDSLKTQSTSNQVNEGEVERWQQILKKLTEVRSLIHEDQLCLDFVKWVPRVARYSYQSRPELFTQ